jgi:hypothetical protein
MAIFILEQEDDVYFQKLFDHGAIKFVTTSAEFLQYIHIKMFIYYLHGKTLLEKFFSDTFYSGNKLQPNYIYIYRCAAILK